MEALRFGILQTQSDGRLAALAARGHERPFEILVARHRAPLLRYCRRLLPDGQAEDAVQQAFLQAWSALRSGVPVDDVRPWLYAIARNQAISALRARRPVEMLDESLPQAGAEAAVEHRATLRAALSGLAGMRPDQREALVRTALAGESHDAVARDLGMSGGAVRQLVHRARLDLRAAATALVPMPIAQWLAATQTRAVPLAERVGELTAGAGGAGLVAGLSKGGAVLAMAGAVAGAAPVVVHHRPAPRPATARVAEKRGLTPFFGGGRERSVRPRPRPAPARTHIAPRPRVLSLPAPPPPPSEATIQAPDPVVRAPQAAPAPAAAAEPQRRPQAESPAPARETHAVAPAAVPVADARPAPDAPAPAALEDRRGSGGDDDPSPSPSSGPGPASAPATEPTDDGRRRGRDGGTASASVSPSLAATQDDGPGAPASSLQS